MRRTDDAMTCMRPPESSEGGSHVTPGADQIYATDMRRTQVGGGGNRSPYDAAMGSLDLFRLDGRVAIVTGASSGLGVAFAQALAEAGGDVGLGARGADPAPATHALARA